MALVPPPIRNASVLGAFVYGHSGEFGPTTTDLRLPGRGLDLELVRSYRSSLADRVGELGRGWSLSLAKRVERVDGDLVYHDGSGLAHRFVREDRHSFASPPGFYGVIAEEKRGVVLRHRHGIVSRFEAPERGGRLRSVGDRNLNAITLGYGANRIDILDSLRRPLAIALAKGRIRELRDHAGRIWAYRYDNDERLVEVLQPATAAFPHGTSLRYGYDEAHRLVSLTDGKGQTWLTVRYDDAGRVIEQRHGSGAYAFTYAATGKRRSAGVRTTCRLRNGGILVVEHDAAGNPLTRTLSVRRDAFAPDDLDEATGDAVPLVTTGVYNRDFELVALTEPAGNSKAWEYAEDEDDPRNRGNCLRCTETPAPGAPADQPALVTTWSRDSDFQVPLAVTDPRGFTTTHGYDERGNRISSAFARVTVQPLVAEGGRPEATPWRSRLPTSSTREGNCCARHTSTGRSRPTSTTPSRIRPAPRDPVRPRAILRRSAATSRASPATRPAAGAGTSSAGMRSATSWRLSTARATPRTAATTRWDGSRRSSAEGPSPTRSSTATTRTATRSSRSSRSSGWSWTRPAASW